MADDKTSESAGAAKEADREPNPFAAPSLSLPKGGGAIKGIGEKFGVNPVNGTGTLSVPVFTTPGRSKFSPNLSLSYNSGAGNGPFGFGWRLSVPNITRKTDKGLPRYFDAEESDVFILSEAEDLGALVATRRRHVEKGHLSSNAQRSGVHGATLSSKD